MHGATRSANMTQRSAQGSRQRKADINKCREARKRTRGPSGETATPCAECGVAYPEAELSWSGEGQVCVGCEAVVDEVAIRNDQRMTALLRPLLGLGSFLPVVLVALIAQDAWGIKAMGGLIMLDMLGGLLGSLAVFEGLRSYRTARLSLADGATSLAALQRGSGVLTVVLGGIGVLGSSALCLF